MQWHQGRLFRFHECTESQIVCHVPAGILESESENSIELYHPDHIVPMEVTPSSGDWRDLSVCLISIHLRQIEKLVGQSSNPLLFDEMESLRGFL